MQRSTVLTGLFTVIALAASAASVRAGAIVVDNFTSNDPSVGANVNGRTPQDANLPGNTWAVGASQATATLTTDSGRQVANLAQDTAVQTGLSGYNNTPVLVVSGVFQQGAATVDDDPPAQSQRGAGIGFYNGTPTTAVGFFTGLSIGPTSPTDSSLSLKLDVNPSNANSDPATVTELPYTGSLTGASDYHTLSYSINTVTGALLSVTLDGQAYSFGAVTPFAAANLPNFGFFVSGNFSSAATNFDSVSLTAVPEPSAWILLGIGAVGLVWWVRGTRRAAAGNLSAH